MSARLDLRGSIPSARHIMANAAETIKGVTLELGGNDPAIILDDASFDSATIRRIMSATFHMTGQVCMAIKRIYVPANRRDEFLDSLPFIEHRFMNSQPREPYVNSRKSDLRLSRQPLKIEQLHCDG